MREEAKKLQMVTDIKIQELSNLLFDSESKEETTKFELLEDDDF